MESHLFTTSSSWKMPRAGVKFDQCLGRSNGYMHWRTIQIDSVVDDTHFYGTVVRSWSEQLDEIGCRAEYITTYKYKKDLEELAGVINEHADYIREAYDCRNVWTGIKYFAHSIIWSIQERLGLRSGRYTYGTILSSPRKYREWL